MADALDYKHMDIEDYESDVPYTLERTRDEYISLILEDIKEHNRFVLSAGKEISVRKYLRYTNLLFS